ncbi:MAG: hypothetical protein H5T76_14510 [Streptomyces sp.]|nr:hypothetical protein [Streptomyces sp.]
MTSDKTASEVFESLNDFDEVAIRQAFGEVTSLKDRPMTFLRALLFTEKRREGLNDKDAKQFAREVVIGDLVGYFRADEDLEAGEA